jgi:UDP-N-acetylmuramyl tripeptide synthase
VATAEEPDVVLEVDEAWLPWAVRTFRPALVMLLNLTRDQLHRNPEVARLAEAWREAMSLVPLVVANADDPWVAWAAETAARTVWVAAGQEWDEDSLVCPSCGDFLDRTDGWSCGCGRARPAPSWTLRPGEIVPPGGRAVGYATLPGRGNLANAAMALAAAVEIGVPPGAAARALARVTDVAGRYATTRVGHHDVRLVLAKNPASWRASLGMLGERRGAVVLAFNADGADGRDTSWLYDVDFSVLRGRTVAVCGSRATDLAVRLDLAGVEILGQYADVTTALHALRPGPVDLLATYTAFQQARRELGRAA